MFWRYLVMTNKKPVISVIVPVYNTEKYLGEALDSVINQTMSDIEIICIDDCSTDNSLQILTKYAQQDKRIKIISHQQNLGCVATKNEGIKSAQGEYIYPFDSDDIIKPNTLEKLHNAIKNNLGDIISCDVTLFGKKNKPLVLPPPTIYDLANRNCIVNSSLFRKNDFLQLSGDGYDPYFKNGLEDYDLWLNFVFKHNKRIYRIPEVLYFYRIKSSKESRNISSSDQHAEYLQYLRLKYPEINIYQNQQKILDLIQWNNKKQYIKLFNIIPLFKIKTKRNISKVYLFNFIPLFKIIKK